MARQNISQIHHQKIVHKVLVNPVFVVLTVAAILGELEANITRTQTLTRTVSAAFGAPCVAEGGGEGRCSLLKDCEDAKLRYQVRKMHLYTV